MDKLKLKIAELRKEKGIGQQELAEVLGVSFQSVSKWETGTTMPDITLLPCIAEYFKVSVDELLGLKPLRQQEYILRNSDDRTLWDENTNKINKNRKYFWNDDYLKFLIDNVWGITEPVNVIDFWCGTGYLGMKLMEMLPEGSTYTGVDSEYFTDRAEAAFEKAGIQADFITSDIYHLNTEKKYDLAICQACLRHVNKPLEVLTKMTESVKKGGLVACVEVNREFENAGTYIDGMSYDYLCTAFDYHKVWRKELECEGRDYAIGMRLPFYMTQLGLHDVDTRMNDKVTFTHPKKQNYEQELQDFISIGGWDEHNNSDNNERLTEFFMSRGFNRAEVEGYLAMRTKISEHLTRPGTEKAFLKVNGLLITFGWK